MAVTTPETKTSPLTVSFDVAFVVPIPKVLFVESYTNWSEDMIATSVVPALTCIPRYFNPLIVSSATLNPVTPVREVTACQSTEVPVEVRTY